MSSRRGFLKNTLGAAWTGAALLEQAVFRATAARAQATGGLPSLFHIEKVAEGVYAAIARPQALINCNAAIFEQEKDLLIVDTHSKPSAVVSLVSQLRREVTQKPVKYIVNSHFHWDHTQGSPTYRRFAPHADIVSSEITRKLISENGAQRLKESVETAQAALPGYKEKATQAKSPQEKSYYQQVALDTQSYINEMKNYRPELPNVTFETDLIIHDKAHDLHLAFRGRGHTAGDVVVYCPQKKVISTGDLMHGFAPYIGDGFPLLWPVTLQAVAMFPFEHLIGGHGAVQHTRERIYQMAGYIEELTELVGRGRRSGRTVEQLQQSITPASLVSLSRGDYGKFLGWSISKYALQPPGAEEEKILANAVSGNIAHIYSALDRN
jgi:cyclase